MQICAFRLPIRAVCDHREMGFRACCTSAFRLSVMVEMAESCSVILADRPDVDLLQGLSAHDLN